MQNSPNILPVHFIIGLPRSGTTLLSAIFNAHPEILSNHELKALLYFWPHRNLKKVTKQLLHDLELYCTFDIEKKAVPHPFKINRKLFDKLPLNKNISYLEFIQEIHLHTEFPNKTNNTVQFLIDKNPGFTYHASSLKKLHPNAKFLICMRDYRGFVSSFYKSHSKKPKHHLYYAEFWKFTVQYIQSIQKCYPGQYMLLPYEEWVSQPEIWIPKICEFLQVPFHANMLQHQKAKNFVLNPIPNSKPKEVIKRAEEKNSALQQAINTKRKEAWKQDLSPKIINQLDLHCQAIASNFGYETFSSEASQAKVKSKITIPTLKAKVFCKVKSNYLQQHLYIRRIKHTLGIEKELIR